jgi:hypothetical protein|tara:strand:+ start:634 stop:1113 length:480 start_codon:yes stop_codon:yes gene_type:complete
MKKFVKFLNKAKDVLGSKGKDIGQLAIAAATGDFKGVLSEVGDILGADLSDDGKALSEEFKISIKEFELEFAKIEAADRDSARDMQQGALQQGDLFSKRFIYYLAAFWSVVGASFVFLVFFIDIPEKNLRLVDTLEGFVLGNIVASVMAFFFGGMNKGD